MPYDPGDEDEVDIPFVGFDNTYKAERSAAESTEAAKNALWLHQKDPFGRVVRRRGFREASGPDGPDGNADLFLTDSASEHVTGEGQGLNAQRAALAELTQQARGGGGAMEAARMQAIRQQAAQQQAGAMRQAQAQAQATGGTGVAARMGALGQMYQGTGNAAIGAEDEARRRQFAAMKGRGGLASSMRGSSFDESRGRSGAANARRQYNMEQTRGAYERNINRDVGHQKKQIGLYTGEAERGYARSGQSEARAAEAQDEALMAIASMAVS